MGFRSENKQQVLLSKIATNDKHGEDSPYFDGWKAYDLDPFHPIQNPRGVIQMGLAENQLSFDLIEGWIRQNPKASICSAEGVSEFKNVANFQDYHGLPRFREAVANFMGRVRGGRVTFDPDRIVMSGGATGANELIMFCLANRGEAFLVPSPYYPAFDRDMGWRTEVQIIPVICDSSTNFQLTRKSLETAYKQAKESNINVKGVLLSNPSNPLGTTLDRDTLTDIVTFITKHNIHLVCDEIYSATVFKSPNFVSVSEIIQDMDSCNPDLVHIVYSLSKDMGLPGFRVGIVYSYNDTVVSCGRKMSSFGLVSSQTQHLLAAMLSDEEFVGKFLDESSRMLAKRHRRFTGGLEEVGINCLNSNAGLFVWMNLSHLLKTQNLEGEIALWRVIIKEVKLNVSPGSSFHCSEPGWFRVCFANMDDETVEVALKRIRAFVGQDREAVETTTAAPEAPAAVEGKKNKRWQNMNLRLSFSSSPRRYDESVMSPHSPIPLSPLLRARN